MDSLLNSIRPLKKNLNQLSSSYSIREMEETSPNSFYKANITLLRTQKEHYRPIFFMCIETKILNKIFAKQIQQFIKKVIHYD
jgi:enhancing lycopene biosynthesis protein 2